MIRIKINNMIREENIMHNLREYQICKADSEEWARYHAIYRLSNYNEWMPLSFQGEIDRYKSIDFCYWVTKNNKRIGGALVKPNMIKCIFTIPPFSDNKILFEKLSLFVDSISVKNKPIEVFAFDFESAKYYKELGYKLDSIDKLMVCATNTYDVTWEENYIIKSPQLEHAEAMAKLYYETYSKNAFSYIAAQSYEFQVSSVNVYFNHIKRMNVPNDWSILIFDAIANMLIAVCTVGLVNGLPYIFDFVVHPEFQRKGLATKIMKRTLDCLSRSYPAIRLNITVGNDAEIFYNKIGFVSLAQNAKMKKVN